MLKLSFLVQGFCAFTVFTAPALATAIWAVDNLGTTNAGTVGDRVIRFDSANPLGTVVTVGATGVSNRGLTGLDFSAAGTLYAVSGYNQDGSPFGGSQLYTINTTTGVGTLVGSTGLSGTNAITDLSWNPVTGTMQALVNAGAGSNSLYTLNLATGAATLVGTITGMSGALGIGLSTNSAGQNFIHNLVDDRMYSLTGLVASPMSALVGIDANFSQGMTMNWRGANEWYLGSISNTPAFASQVRLMNNATGATTSIVATWPNNGASGLPQYETGDLAIAPEPGSLVLMALGAAFGLRARRR